MSNMRLWLLSSSLALLALAIDCDCTPQSNPAATEFSSHRVVQPRLHHARTKRELSSTRDENGAHHPEVRMTVTADGEEYILSLRLNEDIVAAGYTIAYQEDGKTVMQKPRKEDMDLCHYSGVVQGKPESWAAVSTCHGVRGTIFDGQKTLAIEPAEGQLSLISPHYLYNYDDLNRYYEQQFKISDHGLGQSNSQRNLKNSRANRYKRNVVNTQFSMPYNSNNSSRYVELLLVADHKVYKQFGSSIPAVQTQLITLSNLLNSIYSPLNIYIALVGVVVWSERDEITITKENERNFIRDFSKYRERLSSTIPCDHAQLLNTGKWWALAWAYLFSMCKHNSAAIVSGSWRVAAREAAIMAHEMAHSLGIAHDNKLKDCQCPNHNCIMDGSDSKHMHWSSCSIKGAANVFKKGNFECLLNKPSRLFSSGTCGNGFVESGEQCDCGVGVDAASRVCRTNCSDACQLTDNSTPSINTITT